MLEIGRTYTTVTNHRRFKILAVKTKPSTNGCDYIGECLRNGTISYFNSKGINSFTEMWNLNVDFYKWNPVNSDGSLMSNVFLSKEAIDELIETSKKDISISGFLRITNDDKSTISFVTLKDFVAIYA